MSVSARVVCVGVGVMRGVLVSCGCSACCRVSGCLPGSAAVVLAFGLVLWCVGLVVVNCIVAASIFACEGLVLCWFLVGFVFFSVFVFVGVLGRSVDALV